MARGMRRREHDTDRLVYLHVPVAFRAHGQDCRGFVVDERGKVYARWFEGGRVHLAWVQSNALAALVPSRLPR